MQLVITVRIYVRDWISEHHPCSILKLFLGCGDTTSIDRKRKLELPFLKQFYKNPIESFKRVNINSSN